MGCLQLVYPDAFSCSSSVFIVSWYFSELKHYIYLSIHMKKANLGDYSFLLI